MLIKEVGVMGVVNNISIKSFPKQSDKLNKRTKVCFNYDTNNLIDGTIVRDDIEPPYVTIIKLDDNRYVNSSECQYTFPR